MNTEIRHYQPQDLNDLMTAWENASRLAHPFMTEAFFDKERHNIPNMYIPNADTWVVTAAEKVVGFIALTGSEVGGLFVDPAYHGRRLGKALMDKAQELHGDLIVQVLRENAVGRRFYDRYGFKFLEENKLEVAENAVVLKMAFTANKP